MQKNKIELAAKKIVGIAVRTNNSDEFTANKGKIGLTVQRYFQSGIADKIKNRIKPNTTFAVYTKFDSDEKGDYTYLIGEEVSSFSDIEDGLMTVEIPAQKYVKFTNGPGQMPNVCIDIWKHIWAANDDELGGKKAFVADFEVYDERSLDRQNTTLDVYIGIK